VRQLRHAVLTSPDASVRAEALDELSSIRDTRMLLDTLAEILARERDSKVLQMVIELAAQQHERIPPQALRTFVSSDRDGMARAQAVELLADQAGADPPTLALLKSLASKDASAAVKEAAKTALEGLEGPPAPPASALNMTRRPPANAGNSR
jgi:hypothetical protein